MNSSYLATVSETHDELLQDLTRIESGNETYFNEPFDLQEAISDAVQLYRYALVVWDETTLILSRSRNEAARRSVEFDLDLSGSPKMVVGDSKKIRTVVANLTANAGQFCILLSLVAELNLHPSQIHDRGESDCILP